MTRTEQLIIRRLTQARAAIEQHDCTAFHVHMKVLADLEVDLIDQSYGRAPAQAPIEE